MGKKLLLLPLWIFILIPAMLLGQTCPTSVSITSNTSNPTCQPTNSADITYTATTNGGTGVFLYQWKINGANQGAPSTNNTFNATLQNGQTVSVTVTDAGGTTCNVGNNGSPITINVQKTPTVDFQIPPGTKCIGQNITITASNVNGGSNPSYQWYVDGAAQSSTNNKLIRSYSEGKTYSIRAVLTTSIDCYTSQTAEITKTMVIADQATISSSIPDIDDACLNSPISTITFNVGGSATGATVSGLPPGVTGSFSGNALTISGSPTSSGVFDYIVNTIGPCAAATSGGTITVLNDATLALSSGDIAQTVCQGATITNIEYTVGETGTNAIVSGLPAGITGNLSGSNLIISGSSTVVGTHTYSITATGDCGDSETLNGSIIINENLTPTVSISSSDTDNEICEDTEVTFTASATNEGVTPSYQWKINGVNSGSVTTSNTFTTTNLANLDVVSVELTSSETCTAVNPVSSNEITITVLENLTPSVTISANNTDICPGDTVVFSIDNIENAGISPSYQWRLDGSNVGSNSTEYSTSSLTDGQIITLTITSNETCLTTSTANSNEIAMEVRPPAPTNPGSITGDIEVCSSATGLVYSIPTVQNATVYDWNFPSGWSINSGDGTNIVTVSAGTGSGNISVLASNSCGDSATSTIPVTSVDGVPNNPGTITSNLGGNNNICPPYPITFSVASTGPHTWTVPSGWNIVSGAGTNTIQVNVTNAATSGTRQVSVVAQNICGDSTPSTYENIEINNHIVADFGEDQTICGTQNSILLNGTRSFGNATLGVDFSTSGTGNFTGSSVGGNNKNGPFTVTYNPSVADKAAGQVTLTMNVPEPKKQDNTGNDCADSSDSITLYIIKDATISNPGNKNQTVCINTEIDNINFSITDAGTGATVTGLPMGVSGTFNAGMFTIAGTPTESGTFNYTVSTTGTCNQQTSQTGIITVTPDNTIGDAGNKDQTVCIDSPITNMEFPVNFSVTSVDITGMPPGITGSIVGSNFVVTGSPSESGTFNYTLNTVGSCETASNTGILTVEPDVTISNPTNKVQTICINTAVENIDFTITSPGSGAEVTGLPAGLEGNFNNGTFTISGSPIEAGATPGENGIFNYTVTTTGDCAQISQSGIITVKPDPTAEISYAGDFCTSQGGSFSASLTGLGEYSGGSYTATPEGLIIDPSTGDITPGSSLAKTYTVKYEGPDICNRAIATTEVTINEKPNVDISYADPFCTSNSALQDPIFENGTGNFENGTFSAEPGGLLIDPDTGQINPQNSTPGTYDVSYTIDADNGCAMVVITLEVTITQLPQLNISYPESICNSETSVPVTITGEAGAYENGTFSANAGLEIDGNGEIDPSASVPGEYTVIYTILSANGCEEVTASATFTIKDEPIITTEPINTGVCSNSPAQFEVVATGDDLNYEWYRIVNGTAEVISGENNSILSFSNVTSADALEYYVVVTGDDACTSATSSNFTLNVDEDIIITEPSEDITICENQVEYVEFTFAASAGGAPLEYKWMKDGVEVTENPGKIDFIPTESGGEYTSILKITDPLAEDSGVYWVVVEGPDYFTCSDATSNSFSFSVNIADDAPITSDITYCLNDDAVALTATGNGDNEIKWYDSEYNELGNSVTPPTDEATTITYYVTQTKEYPTSNGFSVGCESEYATLVVTVLDKPTPVATETIEFEYCFDEDVTEALSITPAENATINWYDSDGVTSISAPTPNTSNSATTTYYVSQTFTYNETTSCESDKTEVIINIKNLPNVNVSIDGDESTICLGSTISFNATGADSYVWSEGETELGTTTDIDITPTTIGEKTYTVVGTTDGCTNSYDITINVDDVSVAGTLDAPERICISGGSATLELTGTTGEIILWEHKSAGTSDTWTDFGDANLSASRTFSNLTEDTSFRVTVQNGVCNVDTAEATVIVDELPEGGKALWAENNDRLFLTCENPSPGYASNLNLSGFTGTILGWEYRGASDTSWQPINGTTNYLTASEIESVITDESTAFRALISNNSCTDGVYSETAIVSVIEADIKPTPVEVDKEVICIGDQISLSSETGYSADGGKFDGGAFDQAGLDNNGSGWEFTNPDGSIFNFEGSVNNGRSSTWGRMNPHGSNPANEKVYTAELYPIANQSPTNGYMVNFRTFSSNAGNKGFALVTGDNSSFMETPVFSLGGLDEAILTWDQAYNLTEDARIRVEVSTNGGSSYDHTVFDTIGTATSDNYDNFGDLTPTLRPLNKMVVDLGDFLGMSNLRVRFNYEGTIDGDVWAVDNIEVPEGPQEILLQWYYDDDLNDPDSYLEPIGAVNQYTVNFIPRKIGWNDFEVQTRIILDSNGDECQSVDNFETIRVWAFDRYTTTVEAQVGACGSLDIQLNATVTAEYQAKTITEYPTLDGYEGSWRVEDLNGNEITTGFTLTNQDSSTGLDPIEDPNSIFSAENLGDYNFKWVLTSTALDEDGILLDNSDCPPVENPNNVTLIDCTTLDFDGDDDYIDLGNNYNGNFFIEAWIRPYDRPLDDGSGNTNASTGVIFSSSGFEISMDNLGSKVSKNGRWYHIAVSNSGSLWVDGIPSGSITVNGSGINNTSIGARYNAQTKTTSNHFSGWIDELRIWNGNSAPDLKELRFMMNQRIKLNDAATAGTLIEGEVVPNLDNGDGYSSYYTDGAHNLDQDGDKFYNQTWGDLAGYYRLYSDNPDPANLVECATFDDNLKPIAGYTPDHSISKIPGRLVNITTDQENTSPTPYCSGLDGTWANANTWARPAVWDFPNSAYNGTAIDWNIARVNHNITSDSKEIIMLGLLSETPDALLSINGNHPIRITHYLLLDGNMDLVDDSQLLQDHGSILDNASRGWAEIDQEGRMSSFNYNYWTSPFSTQEANNNTGFEVRDILMDGSNKNNPKGINFQDGYFVADGAKTNPITISNFWIWDFRGGDADIYGDWLYLGSDYPEIVGAGFTMKGTTGSASLDATQRYVFRGKPNNGNIPTGELYLQSNQNYLVGNPFPSAIDAYKFLEDNITSGPNGSGSNESSENVFNGTIYFWDHFDGYTHILEEYIGGYATLTKIGSAPAISNDWRITGGSNSVLPQRYIPVAQGFFLNSAPVAGFTFGGDIIFNNTQRIFEPLGSESIFLQQEDSGKKEKSTTNSNSSNDTRMKIRVKFESPKGYHRQILVASDPNTSNGFDIGYDAPLIENNVEDMYWWFGDHGFVIQGVPDFEKEQVLPLAIKTNAGGEFKIKIDETENWPSSKELYLKDRLLDTVHDILKEDYVTKTDNAGEITDRFELVFFKQQDQNPDPIIPDPEDIVDPNPDDLPYIDNLVGISYSTFSKQIKISNFDLVNVDKVMVFDMGGKLIQVFNELPTIEEIRLGMQPVRSGIYIVKVIGEQGVTDKKIIIR